MGDGSKKFGLPKRYAGSEESVWVEYNELAFQYKPLNLGHGFPDFPPPAYITEALSKAVSSDNNLIHQYTRGFGHPRLVAALSKFYSHLLSRTIDAQNELLITCGAYEALYSAIIGHVDSGDEVIIIEPYFDCYEPMVRAAGGVARFIPLRFKSTNKQASSADWVLDPEELESLFSTKTKAIIINTPHNPLGKVFTLAELEVIANLCKKWNVLCISDEVYEWMVYGGKKHIRIATLPGMWERTITIGSAGKSFSVTGWKIGWAYGPANLMQNLRIVHQNCLYTICTPTQEAVAVGFETEMERFGTDASYFTGLARKLEMKRNFLVKLLTEAGMKAMVPDGGFFVVADWSSLEKKVDLSSEKDSYKDYRFTKWMIKHVGVMGIPPSTFFSEDHKYIGENLVRFCFIKNDEKLEKAAEILKCWKLN